MFGALALIFMPFSMSIARAADVPEYKHIFIARLSGSHEVPQVTTDANGYMLLKVREDEQVIRYRLDVRNGMQITDAHLHCGAPGVNGPAVVDLYTPTNPTNLDGESIVGRILPDDVMEHLHDCDPGIRTLPHLVQAMREGKIYVNVHSVEHPSGLIRGQAMMPPTDLAPPQEDDDTDNDDEMENGDEDTNGDDDTMNGDDDSGNNDEGGQGGGNGDVGDDDDMTPGPNGAHILLSSYFVVPPDDFAVHGHRFAANESVRVTALGNTYTVQADQFGSFHVPDIGVALHQADTLFPIEATGLTSGIRQMAMLKVGTYYPVVTPNTWFIDGGEEVLFRGRHFGPSEDVQISVDGVDLVVAQSDPFGGLAHDVHVPQDPGTYTFGFTGLDSGVTYELDMRVY